MFRDVLVSSLESRMAHNNARILVSSCYCCSLSTQL